MESKWPMMKLEKVLEPIRETAEISPLESYKQITVRLHHKGIILRGEKNGEEIKSKQYFARKEQFLISRIDARNGAMGLVPPELDGAIVTNDFLTYDIDKNRLFPRYFDYLTSTKGFVDECIRASEGTTNRVRLKPDKFLEIEIPFPPLEEQERIVARIEELLSRTKEARRLRAEAVREAEEMFERGESKIFEELAEERGTIAIEESPISLNPEQVNPKEKFGERSFIYIDLSSVAQNTGKILEKKEIMGINAPSRARRKMRKDDVVFGAVRPNLKRCFVVFEDLDEHICSTGFTIFRPEKEKINPYFLRYQLLSDFFINQSVEEATGAHYPAINDKNMRKLLINIPSIDIQRRIVAYLDSLQAKVDELKKLQKESEKEMEELVPSILDKAFKGEM